MGDGFSSAKDTAIYFCAFLLKLYLGTFINDENIAAIFRRPCLSDFAPVPHCTSNHSCAAVQMATKTARLTTYHAFHWLLWRLSNHTNQLEICFCIVSSNLHYTMYQIMDSSSRVGRNSDADRLVSEICQIPHHK